MAKTAEAIAEWPLLCDALALVTSYTKSEDAAKTLILEYHKKGRIAYGWHQPDRPDLQLGQVPGSQWGHVAWGQPFHDDKTGTHIVTDWHNSCATYIRLAPASELGRDILVAMKDYLPVSPIIRMPLIRLCRHDLINILVEVGLMPAPPSSPSPLPPPPPPSPPRLTLKEAARLGPTQWLVSAVGDFPLREGETREEYAERLARKMGKDRELKKLKKRVWTAGYIVRRLYDLDLLPQRQPRAKKL